MSRRALLEEMDSAELTAWFVYLDVKHEKAEEDRERNRMQRELDTP